jgi:molybdopterin synthase catalytic subunit
VVTAAAAHRQEALAACAYVIEELKSRVPIWKKEFGEDGTFWIEGPGSCRTGKGPEGSRA